jgi:uncharacterized membrane protein
MLLRGPGVSHVVFSTHPRRQSRRAFVALIRLMACFEGMLRREGPPGILGPGMSKNRLEAFSDGMIAIFITVMVLELKVPHGGDWAALRPLLPPFLTYVLSYVFLGIYWSNHHHLLHAADKVNGSILWANLHLLFWLSLIPVTTGWMGDNHLAPVPTAAYGVVLLLSAVAYTILQQRIIASQGGESKLKQAVGRDRKGKLSLACYASAVPLAFLRPWIAILVYVFVALIWLVPDRRIEHTLHS